MIYFENMNKSEEPVGHRGLESLGMSRTAESPKKSNFSLKFNIDIKNVMSDESSDSENADLQIDIAEIDNYDPAQKRMRIEVDETSALNEMEEEIERQLDAKAAKTNLTATNVKNILRHVITNEHVMAMVQNRLQNADDKILFEPKLTRAKAKELALKQPNMRWPMTPVKKTSSSEVQELIEKDLSEDSSDEEYSPDQDQQSDDEAEGDHLTNSDADSQQRAPTNAGGAAQTLEQQASTELRYDNDGVFKIPEIPHGPKEVESIGQRTRSKLSLSETPLEQIEQAFIPPDITIDMYDWDCGKDPDWDNFLKEFTQPLGHDAANEDDPEADPEYNILEDKETDLLDKEELRMDKAVKVTKKELNDLVAELFEFEDMFSKNQVEAPKKKNTPDNSLAIVQDASTNNCMVDLLPALAEPELPKLVSPEQLSLLTTQLRQHVQLMTQHFGMTYMHPEFHPYAKKCKENLKSLSYLTDGSSSVFNVENLSAALEFVSKWEDKFKDDSFTLEYTKFVADENQNDFLHGNGRHKYEARFHPELARLFIESKALMYPHLLPMMQFRTYLVNASRMAYVESEDFLIALGLEQFYPVVKEKTSKFRNKTMVLMDVAQMIHKYMMPCRPTRAIFKHIIYLRASKKPNPIKHYYETGSAPRTIHCITLDSQLIPPKDQPRQCLPLTWQQFMQHEYRSKSRLKKKAYLGKTKMNLIATAPDMIVGEIYRNPVVNMLPKVSHNNQLPRISDDGVAETNEVNAATMSDAGTSQATRSPQLRKTTPRLAKIRSAQNMKLMTQVAGSKGLSSYAKVKSRAKSECSKDSEESCGSSKGDNEDEIAELMLASTTIKKDSANRKKAKQARELENIKRLLNAESESAQEERAAKFAESFLQKLHVTMEASSPETLRAVFKIFTEYNEKVENMREKHYNDVSRLNGSQSSVQSNEGTEKGRKAKDFLAINLYKDVCNVLHDYPELRTDFLLFLNPHQASMIDESTQHTMLQKMSEFMNVVQIYFAKQPSRLTRIMKAITQLTSNRYVTMADVHTAMDPILRGHQLVMDMFLQVLPMGKPPDSLFAMNLFENLTCPMGPYDKHKVYTEDSPELFENIEIPLTSQEDPYGGDNCKCDCHDSSDSGLKSGTAHCVSCGTRFLNGKIYLQTSEGLRPAKITFPGDDEEQLENIARISLKTTERFVPGLPAVRRRKSSKNEPGSEESNQKLCPAKTSPIKDNDDGERSTLKSKRGAKSPPKSADQRKTLKANEVSWTNPGTSSAAVSAEPTSPLKSKRETRAERREAKLELIHTGSAETSQINEETSSKSDQSNDSGARSVRSNLCSSDSDMNITCESIDAVINKSDSNVSMELEETINLKPWTRHEDMILLQNIKKDYSESTFVAVSEMLGDRTVDQVEERCQTLLSLLEKMV